MKTYKMLYPDFFTLFNLFCGFWAIISVFEGQPYRAAWLIFLSGIADCLDGRIARATKLESRFGIEFDSLADVVSFGVVPAVLVYYTVFSVFGFWGIIPSFIIISGAAIRLARFNITTTLGPKKGFIGLPSPIAALTIGSFYLFSNKIDMTIPLWFWLLIVLSIGLLMISNISYDPLPNLTFKKSKSNTFKLILVLVTLILVLIFREIPMFPFLAIYVIYGLLRAGINVIANGKPGFIVRVFHSF